MGSIPLPALGVQTQQADPVGQYGKIVALKEALANQQFQQQERPLQLQSAQAQNQVQQQQLHDMQVGTQALHDSDGDYTKYLENLRKGGVSPQTYMTAQKSLFDLQNQKATLDKTTLENQKAQFDQFQAHADGIQAALDKGDQQTALGLAQDAVTKAEQAGLVKPGQLQPQQLLQPGVLSTAKAALGFQSQITKEALDKQEAAQKDMNLQTSKAELPGKQAQAQKSVAEQQALNFWLQKNPGKTEADYEVAQAGRKAGAEAGARLGAEKSLEQFKVNLQRGLLPQELQSVAPQLVPAAASQYIKASTDYSTAVNAQQEMDEFIKLAKSGNKVAYAYSPTTGVLTINSANGTKRVNMAEIGSYSGAGSAFDRLSGWFGKQISGASIPDDILNDMQQVHDHLGETAQQKYANQVQATNATYGSKFKSQDFGGQKQGQVAPQLPKAIADQIPEGHVSTLSDGSKWKKVNGQVSPAQ